LFSPAGDATGTALLSNGSAHFSLHSPIFDMGTNIDYPILTVAVPVKSTATRGETAFLNLDPSFSQWVDPTGQNYPVLLTNGIVTVGGTISISDIVPGEAPSLREQKLPYSEWAFDRIPKLLSTKPS
jgi:hypothetical protein